MRSYDALSQSVTMLAATALASSGSTRLVVPGPWTIVLWGVDIPTLSAAIGAVGVILGQLLAPVPTAPLGGRRRAALVVALLGLELGIVIATGQQPLVAMGWGIGLGFSGLAVAQALGDQALSGVRKIADAFISMIAAKVGGKPTNAGSKDGENV
ncbi:hypothetical protein DBR17_17845 [Sphingomonas sp. HMWF008]|nr:hypothetical protein DBR17_17845 [Sphingomonas sp. HMWF008]